MISFETIAAACYEGTRVVAISAGQPDTGPWADTPDWIRQSCLDGVKFHLDNPLADPSAAHVAWSEAKTRDGWVYWPVKDVEKKQHPCLVPYYELPDYERAKARLFCAVVDALSPYLEPM